MNCWAVLELDPQSDERSIKRQYARLLKLNRPDDDPVAFQNLRDAYELAMRLARQQRTDEPSEAAQAPDLIATPPTHTASPIQQAVDPEWLKLARQTQAQNLPAQHEIALEHRASEPFQQWLLSQCLGDPARHVELIKAAFEHLHWLTVLQTIQIHPYQQDVLVEAVLRERFTSLKVLLDNNESERLVSELSVLDQQPWLAAVEHREQLQRWCMALLLSSKSWPSQLFDQISLLFGWSNRDGVHPGPEDLWQGLIERCEEIEYAEHLEHALASKPRTLEGKAAELLLKPPRMAARMRTARRYDERVWKVCQHIHEQLTGRYTDILALYPDADLDVWKHMRQQSDFTPVIWVYAGAFMMELLAPGTLPAGAEDSAGTRVIGLFLTPFWMTTAFLIFSFLWRPLMLLVEPVDAWLSTRMLPRALSWPGAQALIIRHGLPFLVVGLFYAITGLDALLLYFLLIGLWVTLSPYRHLEKTAHARQKIRGFYTKHTVLVVFSAAALIMGAMISASKLGA